MLFAVQFNPDRFCLGSWAEDYGYAYRQGRLLLGWRLYMPSSQQPGMTDESILLFLAVCEKTARRA